jgi:chlorobactene glucosyltransferase
MILYQLFVLGSLLVFLGIVLKNLSVLSRLPAVPDSAGIQPSVSLLVPARNEELNIERCVRSLLAQRYPDFEVIVLDDHSTDGTHMVLNELVSSASDARLRIIDGRELPAGWHGKSWACQQLGEQAIGELLLFTDADTCHQPDALSRAVEAVHRSGADMLSLTPAQEAETFWEKLIIPLVYHILFSYLPLEMVWKSRYPAFCYAIGQFILFRRDTYVKIGGHRSVSDNLVEDVWLCKAVKRAGGNVVVYNGSDVVHCRMYRGFGEVWKGFSKNLYAGLGNSIPGLLVLMALVVMLYLAPWGFFLLALLCDDQTPAGFWIPGLQIAVALLIRVLIALKFRQTLWSALMHGFSQVVLLAIAFNSFRVTVFGKGPEWKGRNYSFLKHDR